MRHLSEGELILHYYGETRDPAAEEHLAGCAPCQASYQALREVLAAVDAAPAPERGEEYGRLVWARLRPRLERSSHSWRDLFTPQRWVVAAVMALLLVAAFLAGRYWPERRQPTQRASEEPARERVRERILLVAVGDHLEQSQMVLVELVNASGNGSVDISTEQRWAEDLVGANRLYRQTAASIGEAGLAGVLDDLERILLEIAHSPSKISSRELNEIRRRIEREGILFKVRVIASSGQWSVDSGQW